MLDFFSVPNFDPLQLALCFSDYNVIQLLV